MYTYHHFKVVRVIDGDTVKLTIDTCFGNKHEPTVRLAGINAPETRGQPDDVEAVGRQAKEWLVKRLSDPEATLWLDSDITKKGWQKKGSFGRYIVTIYDLDVNINQEMVDLGLAWEYGAPKDIELLKRKQQDCGRF